MPCCNESSTRLLPVPYPSAHQVGPRMAVWLVELLGHLQTVMTKLPSMSEGNRCLRMHSQPRCRTGVTVCLQHYYYYYYYLPPVYIPEGGLKIDENKLKGYDAQSMQSGTGRLLLCGPPPYGGGRILRRTLSVRLSVCLSVCPVHVYIRTSVTCFRQPCGRAVSFVLFTCQGRIQYGDISRTSLFLFYLGRFIPEEGKINEEN